MNKKAFFLSLLFVYFNINFSTSSDKCTLLNDKDTAKSSLLNSISVLSPIKYFTASNGYSYAVSVCSDVSKVTHPNASVTRTLIAKNITTVLGRRNETDIISMGDNKILLTYSGGDNLNESVYCNNTKWKTLIFVTCDFDADDITIDLQDPLNGGCFALFHLKTSVTCPPRQSYFWKWFFIIIFSVAAYFIIGIFYKRYVEGAKGWEQVPHHDFLRNPLQHLMGCLGGKDTSAADPRNIINDPADEPLLRP